MAFVPTDAMLNKYNAGTPAWILANAAGVSCRTFQRNAGVLVGARLRGGQKKYFCDENVFDALPRKYAIAKIIMKSVI